MYRDPVLLAFAAVGAVVIGWLVAADAEPGRQAQVGWLAQLALDSCLGVIAYRIAQRPGLPHAVRRFYRALAFTGSCFAAGDASQVVTTFVWPGPEAGVGGPIQTGTLLLGVSAALLVLLFYPTMVGTRRERLRFWLDAVTVLLGGAAMAWALAADPGADRATALIGAGLVLLATFSATKLLYSSAAPMTRRAVLPCIAATTALGLSFFASGALSPETHLGVALALQTLSSVLLTSGFRIQELEVQAGRPWPVREVQRSHNKLPYVATCAATGTLVAVLPASAGSKAWGVLLAVVAISVLVSIRQMDAFADNEALIGRLDKSLAAIGEKERWFRSLLQHSTDITLVLDADGRVTFASPAVEHVLGLPVGEAVGLRLADLVHPDDRDATDAAFGELQARPGGTMKINSSRRSSAQTISGFLFGNASTAISTSAFRNLSIKTWVWSSINTRSISG